ncbi:hypothetical protein ACFFNY_34945 [Paenibacillus hodogayensis]|uniref:Uncharacterized protein n=1 Tax=Paenibacillus hodogayensis TaxID=279208 RepID=A0ABV5W890_9BACL
MWTLASPYGSQESRLLPVRRFAEAERKRFREHNGWKDIVRLFIIPRETFLNNKPGMIAN